MEFLFFSFLLNASFYSGRSYETISMPFGGLKTVKMPKMRQFRKMLKKFVKYAKGGPLEKKILNFLKILFSTLEDYETI